MRRLLKISAFFLVSISSYISAEPTCARCEEVREHNKHRTDYYEYYDDYVKEHPEEAPKHDDRVKPLAPEVK